MMKTKGTQLDINLDHLTIVILALVILGLYWLTIAPGVVGGDAGEFQFVPFVLGIPHSTGYPLYILLGKIWSALPLGSVALRMNLLSALFTTGASIFIYYCAREFNCSRIVAALAGLSLALNGAVWEFAIIASIRSLNILFFALIFWLALRWRHALQRDDRRLANRWLIALALAISLSLANHRTTLFLLPGVIFYFWSNDPQLWRYPRRLSLLLILALLPAIALYLWLLLLALNAPVYSWWTIESIGDWWELISGKTWGSAIQPQMPFSQLAGRLLNLGGFMLRQMSLVGLVLALVGLIRQRRDRPKETILLGLPAVLLLFFTLIYDIGGAQIGTKYLLPIFSITAIWFAQGLMYLRERLRLLAAPFIRMAVMWLVFIVATGSLGFEGASAWRNLEAAREQPIDDYRQRLDGYAAMRFAESALQSAEPKSLIVADWEQATTLWYYQFAEGWRPDITIRQPLDFWREWLQVARNEGKTVYIARKFPDLEDLPYLSMAGPLIKIGERPNNSLPNGMQAIKLNFADQIALLGYQQSLVDQPSLPGYRDRQIVVLNLAWQALRKPERDYAISIRVINSDGKLITQKDSSSPLLGLYPTTRWSSGEIVVAYQEIALPKNIPAMEMQLEIIAYCRDESGQFHNLPLINQPDGADRDRLPPLPWE